MPGKKPGARESAQLGPHDVQRGSAEVEAKQERSAATHNHLHCRRPPSDQVVAGKHEIDQRWQCGCWAKRWYPLLLLQE